MLLGPLFWYCEIQGFHTFLGLRRLDPYQGPALHLSGAYNVPRPPAMLSNDLRSLHILSKTRLSIPHLLGGGGNFKCILQGRGEENFLTLPLKEIYIPPPTHRKNDTSLRSLAVVVVAFISPWLLYSQCTLLSKLKQSWRLGDKARAVFVFRSTGDINHMT